LCKDVFFGGDFNEIKLLIQTKRILANQINFYLGCASWEPGQLLEEVADASWIEAMPNKEMLFHPHHKTLWKRAMVSLGGNYIALANAPESPAFN
jgi:putative transcriptional regulator